MKPALLLLCSFLLLSGSLRAAGESFINGELKLLQKYILHAKTAKKERITLYGLLPDGTIVETPGEMILESLTHNNIYPEIQAGEIHKIAPDARPVLLHTHPIKPSYGGFYQQILGTDFMKSAAEIENEHNSLVEKIKSGELFTAWPPSIVDIKTIVIYEGYLGRVADGRGIWSYEVDKNTPKGREIAGHGNYIEKLNINLEKAGYDKNTSDELLIEVDKTYNTPDYTEELSIFNNTYLTVKAKTLSEFLGPDFPTDTVYTIEQMKVSEPQKDRTILRSRIENFITWCREIGLRVTYTEFE